MGNVLDEPMPQVEYPAWMAAEERLVTLQVSGNDLLWRIEQSWVEVSLQAKGGVENPAGMVDSKLVGDFERLGAPDAMDISERDDNALVGR